MTGLEQGYVEYAGDLIKQPKARVVPQFHIALHRCRLSAPPTLTLPLRGGRECLLPLPWRPVLSLLKGRGLGESLEIIRRAWTPSPLEGEGWGEGENATPQADQRKVLGTNALRFYGITA